MQAYVKGEVLTSFKAGRFLFAFCEITWRGVI